MRKMSFFVKSFTLQFWIFHKVQTGHTKFFPDIKKLFCPITCSILNSQVFFSERNKPSSRSLSTVARQVYFSPQLHVFKVSNCSFFIFHSHPKLVLIALQATKCINLETQCIVCNVWCVLQKGLNHLNDIHL